MAEKLSSIIKFVLKTLAFLMVFHLGTTIILGQWFTDWLNNSNIGAEGILLVITIELVIPLIVSILLAIYFSNRKHLPNYALAMMLFITPLYIWLYYVNDTSSKGFQHSVDVANMHYKSESNTGETIDNLSKQIQTLESKIIDANSPLNSISISYDESKFDIVRDTSFYDGALVGATYKLPILKLTLKEGNPNKYYGVLEIIDLSGIQRQPNTELVDHIARSNTENPSPFRQISINNKKYSFKTSLYLNGDPTGEDCGVTGIMNKEFLAIEDMKLGIIITHTQDQEGCEGERIVITQTSPDSETIEEILEIVESIEFTK